ncbi:MAG TPA: ATP synthase F1 subunit epsilon [Candidatus Taylorbacteria bacterium]|nr:MAG: ATP synthase F1 sector epsilon subunit [Parcubacteria group bacterium GW2011_GWA2_47_64]KKU97181.1 MAG: ATP synthase F1 sector epsilon subunit [Parcubacteria group bacterium GW2011_GWC2_48_17]HBV01630.1 ATP synthase F1 subunit epsilon [Candidatus Taylorbacteria bacterium]
MADTLQLKIVSLKEVVYDDYVDSVTLPTKAGEITVLPNHVPLISHLSKGSIRARCKGQQKSFELDGGFMEVTSESRLTVVLQ